MNNGYRDPWNEIGALNEGIQLIGGGKADIAKPIQDLFSSFDLNQALTGYNLDLKIDGNDPIEYYNNLHDILLKIDDIKNTSAKGLTKSEENLYNSLKNQYDRLDKVLNGKEFSLDNYNDSMDAMARYYMNVMPRANRTTEEWKEALFGISEVANNQFLKAAIDNILKTVEAEERLTGSIQETNNPLAEMLSNLQSVENTCKSLTEEIKTADESFEKLANTIETNNDVDKFFSASEIIDILELYPSLYDAIQETAYGYKIEKDALESLRQTKLEEKKTALQAQLDEAQGLLDTTKAKLELYKQDINGIKDIAEARMKLAELEVKLANVGAEAFHHRRTQKSEIESEMAKYQDFIDTNEAIEKQQEVINKLGIELAVLGTVHDKAKDAASDYTNELNKQKDSIQELNEEYKKGQDAINDLVKLTTDMLKKNAELRKDDLKEQLDSFKKLIEKRKELISLEKDCTKRIVRCYWKRWQANPFELLEYRKAIYTTT